jgi:hypothetical protein
MLVQIDLLQTEFEGFPATGKLYQLHPQYSGIKVTARLDLFNGEHQVIESGNFHGCP